jgi:hypothetical protein
MLRQDRGLGDDLDSGESAAERRSCQQVFGLGFGHDRGADLGSTLFRLGGVAERRNALGLAGHFGHLEVIQNGLPITLLQPDRNSCPAEVPPNCTHEATERSRAFGYRHMYRRFGRGKE